MDWWKPDDHYDVVYASKVFSESKLPEITNADQVILGGSGIDLKNKLPYEVEHSMPDYALYPQYDFALGFLTRGCPRLTHAQSHGGFCITPDKDGCVPRKVANLDEFWTGQKNVVLLDQNLLACKDRMELIQQLSDSKATFEFNGGMDARYMSDEVINAFRSVKVKDFHFAWDDPRENMLPHMEYEYQQIFGVNETVVDGYSGFIFQNRYGEILSAHNINRAIERIYKAYNAEERKKAAKERRKPVLIRHFSVHNLRHTFCTRYCENESDLKVIQEIMGHADIETTLGIYAEATEQKKKESFASLEGKIRIS